MTAQVLTPTRPEPQDVSVGRWYEHQDTRDLVELVNEAAERVRVSGMAAFDALRASGSRWRRDDTYIFVLDLDGNMLVHPDPAIEGTNQLDLKDVNGKPIIRGLIDAATAIPGKRDGWYHYQWPVPGGLLPRWKSSYVELVTSPSGANYVVGAGVYNDRMEKGFVVDLVTDAAARIEQNGEAAFPLFRDPTGPFMAKDAYLFVIDGDGIELLNPAFPTLEGRSLLDFRDALGAFPIRAMLNVVRTSGHGWVDYMWPKPGESVPTQKSAYVTRSMLNGKPVVVGSGVYFADAPKLAGAGAAMTAAEVMTLVREAARLVERRGDAAFAELKTPGSKWFHDDTYFFAWTTDGTLVLSAVEPALEGRNERNLEDVLGRPIGRMVLEIGASESGEGWLHYMYPQPGQIFPSWKSAFLKRVAAASGTTYLLGCGSYNMRVDKPFVEDVVHRAAALIAQQGPAAFDQLRDRKGPFMFMDTYVFVQSPEGIELVNPVFPALEGRNLIDLKDVKGTLAIREEVTAALERGSAWVDLYWFRPGTNSPARKQTYVQKVESGGRTYIVGSGIYVD